ncbi:unnamed protein product, partial [Brachionus calyciflorus]
MNIIIFVFLILINKSLCSNLISLKNLPDSFIYNSNVSTTSRTWSRLYSNQLNDNQLNKYFKIVNKTSIEITQGTSRESFCNSIVTCTLQPNSTQCILDLSLIVYINNESNKSNFNEIKLVKLQLLLSDWSNDYLYFDQLSYEFRFDPQQEYLSDDMHEFGIVKATSFQNSDLNNLVRYYIDFEEKSKVDLMELISINQQTGSLIVNRTKLISQKFASDYVFYVDALIKCSQNQKPLYNRTEVKLSFQSDKAIKPIINLISLVEQKKLGFKQQCFKISQNDFLNSNKIALAQIQIENFDLKKSYEFKISESSLDIKIENIVDNLFVVYLLKNTSLNFNYMSEIFKIKFKLANQESTIYSEFFICLNVQSEQDLYEELSLIEFKSNLRILGPNEKSIILEAHGSSDLNFMVDPTSSIYYNFKLDKISNKSARLVFDPIDKDDQIVYEIIVIAFDSNIPVDRFLKYYSYLKQLSYSFGKFLKFTTKVLLQTEKFDSTSSLKNYDLNQQVIGYLPSIFDIVPREHFLNYENTIENYFYNSNLNLTDCINLHKFTGILTKSKNCTQLSENLKVIFTLENTNTKYRVENFSQINLAQSKNDSNRILLLNINSSLVKNEFDVNFEFNLNLLDNNISREIEIIRIVSKEDDSTTYFLNGQMSEIFTLDQKLGSLSLNLTKFLQQNSNILFKKCLKMELTSTGFNYSNLIRRKVKSNDLIEINLCFSLNSQQKVFIHSSLSKGFSFQFLRVQNLNESIVWICFLSLFMTSSLLLVVVLFYLYSSIRIKENFTEQYSSSSQCQLKIRNDDLYQSIENGLVPSKLDILLNKKPLSPDTSNFIEISSIKEISEDQGVYCVASGASFTSDLSSASECVDSVSECSEISRSEIVLGRVNLEESRLSL